LGLFNQEGKGIEKRRVKKDYRKYYRIFLALFLLSFGANLFVLTFYLKERISWLSFLKEGKEARKVTLAKGAVPFSLVHIKNGNSLLLCEKHGKTLYLYQSEEDAFRLIKSYPCIVGSNNVDKKEAGDLATPEGIYFLISFLEGKSLAEKYGRGAFSLNYPNFLDQKEGKKGSGIWLHGFPDHMERPVFSEGCVVIKDEFLKELVSFIKIGETPLVIVDTIQYQPQENQQRLRQTLSHFLEEWKRAWESLDTEKYLSFYSRDFVNGEGMNYQRFKEHKKRVNRSKKFIKLQIENKAILLSQKEGGQIAVVRLNQDYSSDNFKSYTRKILYLKEEQGKWTILGDISLRN
jgi:murein L,D-transpeptidase YafK